MKIQITYTRGIHQHTQNQKSTWKTRGLETPDVFHEEGQEAQQPQLRKSRRLNVQTPTL